MVSVRCFLFSLIFFSSLLADVKIGLERLPLNEWKGKKIGIVMNQASISKGLKNTYQILLEQGEKGQVIALFTPEHGLFGIVVGAKDHKNEMTKEGIPVYNIYNVASSSTQKLLQKVDVLVYDIQDLGCRSYTYASTLFELMEASAKTQKTLYVLDRPNPINGLVVDGPMVDEGMECFASYIDIPYCHGMTIGELATYFNEEYKLKCPLKVVWMEGWKRKMTFEETGLPWIPLSPNVPSSKTAFYYAMTGFIGEIPLANNGIGTTLPFQAIGAPWIEPIKLKEALDKQKLPGVVFTPFHFAPMKGRLANTECRGLYIIVTDPLAYKPATTGLTLLGLLKSLYPAKVKESLTIWPKTTESFSRIMGTKRVASLLLDEQYPTSKLVKLDEEKRTAFLLKRKNYLHYD